MRRTFAHRENHIITLGSALTRLHVRNVTARSSWRGCAKSTFSLEKSPSLKKTTEIGKLAAIKPGELQPWSNVASVFLRIWSALTGIHLVVFNKALKLVARKM